MMPRISRPKRTSGKLGLASPVRTAVTPPLAKSAKRLARHPGYHKGTQLDFLCAGGYEHRAYGMNAVYPHGHHGNAILSRYAIHNFTNHDVSDHALEKRGLLHAVARAAGNGGAPVDVHLLCVHFGLINRSRLRQASFLIDFVEQEVPKGAPMIIAGDFNDWQRRVDTLLRGRLQVDEVCADLIPERRSVLDRLLPWRGGLDAKVSVARTFPSFAPWLTLDRIYVRGFKVLAMQVPKGIVWAKRSDHAPLIAELELA
jgi:endonuclease/exonuclease/phosphatase family metal-dependent hydrolase